MAKVVIDFDAKTQDAIQDIDKLKSHMGHVGDDVGSGVDTSLTGAEGKIRGFGSKFKAGAFALGAGFLGGLLEGGLEKISEVVVDQLQKSIEAASNLQETQSKVRQVFGQSAPAILSWGRTSAKAMGMSERGAEDAASQFAVLGKAAGLTGPELVGFSTELTNTAADMASFSNTTPEDAIVALAAGLRGESEPLRAYGILLDDAALRQEALALGLIKTTNQALTPQQKVLASHAVIMQQLGDQAGDFARTSEGTANQQRILTAEIENTQAAIGQKLLPVFDKLLKLALIVVEFIAERVVPTFDLMGSTAQSVADAIGAAWNWLASTAVTVWTNITQTIINAGNWIQARWNQMIAWFGTIPGAIAGALSGAYQAVTGVFSRAFDTVKGWIGGVGSWFGSIPGAISSALSGVFGAITGPFQRAVDFVRGLVGQVASAWNAVASGINSVSVTFGPIPDWVPGIGGQSWTFDPPNVPYLARGAYVRSPTLALVGEGRGAEFVTPEPMLRRVLREETGGGARNYTINVTVPLGASPAEVGRTIVNHIRAFERAAGRQWRTA